MSKVGAPAMREIWEDPVATDEPLWRYFLPERFITAIERRELYFAAARQFEDPFEGATAIVERSPAAPRFEVLDHSDRAFEQLRRLTKISCWNRGAFESEAMWKLYARQRKGVAVRTTTGQLAQSLQAFRLAPSYGEEEPWWGVVRYVDLSTIRLRVSNVHRFFFKHVAFESERELRIAIPLTMAEEFGVQVPEDGISVPFSPDVLIEQIILGPDMTANEQQAVRQACERVGLGERVRRSTLLWHPRYI